MAITHKQTFKSSSVCGFRDDEAFMNSQELPQKGVLVLNNTNYGIIHTASKNETSLLSFAAR